MKPEFRIIKNDENKFEVYYVKKKRTIFKNEVLKPFIKYLGTDEVYPFSNIENALIELKQEVIKQTHGLW